MLAKFYLFLTLEEKCLKFRSQQGRTKSLSQEDGNSHIQRQNHAFECHEVQNYTFSGVGRVRQWNLHLQASVIIFNSQYRKTIQQKKNSHQKQLPARPITRISQLAKDTSRNAGGGGVDYIMQGGALLT